MATSRDASYDDLGCGSNVGTELGKRHAHIAELPLVQKFDTPGCDPCLTGEKSSLSLGNDVTRNESLCESLKKNRGTAERAHHRHPHYKTG